MPTPIAHSLTNLSVYYVVNKGSWKNSQGKLDFRGVAIFLFLSIFPDLDFLPGLLIGKPNAFHHYLGTHSFLFLFMTSLLLAWMIPFFMEGVKRSVLFAKNAVLCFSMLIVHITLDYFTVDNSFPYGIKLFWPSDVYHIFPNAFFPTLDRSREGLLKVDNLLNLLVELIIFSTFFTITCLVCRRIFRKEENI